MNDVTTAVIRDVLWPGLGQFTPEDDLGTAGAVLTLRQVPALVQHGDAAVLVDGGRLRHHAQPHCLAGPTALCLLEVADAGLAVTRVGVGGGRVAPDDGQGPAHLDLVLECPVVSSPGCEVPLAGQQVLEVKDVSGLTFSVTVDSLDMTI